MNKWFFFFFFFFERDHPWRGSTFINAIFDPKRWSHWDQRWTTSKGGLSTDPTGINGTSSRKWRTLCCQPCVAGANDDISAYPHCFWTVPIRWRPLGRNKWGWSTAFGRRRSSSYWPSSGTGWTWRRREASPSLPSSSCVPHCVASLVAHTLMLSGTCWDFPKPLSGTVWTPLLSAWSNWPQDLSCSHRCLLPETWRNRHSLPLLVNRDICLSK